MLVIHRLLQEETSSKERKSRVGPGSFSAVSGQCSVCQCRIQILNKEIQKENTSTDVSLQALHAECPQLHISLTCRLCLFVCMLNHAQSLQAKQMYNYREPARHSLSFVLPRPTPRPTVEVTLGVSSF